jgi:hypothetical protein
MNLFLSNNFLAIIIKIDMCLFNLFIIETINMMNTLISQNTSENECLISQNNSENECLISQNTSENECLIYKKENKKIINLDDYKNLKYQHFHDETL